MNTNWMAWVLGAAVAFVLMANAAGSRSPRQRLTVEEMINFKIQQLKSPDYTIRYDAARALGVVKAVQAVPALIEALEDPHPAVRDAAQLALSRIGATAMEDLRGRLCAATISLCDTRNEKRPR